MEGSVVLFSCLKVGMCGSKGSPTGFEISDTSENLMKESLLKSLHVGELSSSFFRNRKEKMEANDQVLSWEENISMISAGIYSAQYGNSELENKVKQFTHNLSRCIYLNGTLSRVL